MKGLISFAFGFLSAAVQAHNTPVYCGMGKLPTPSPYRNNEVHLPHMRDPKSKDECNLRRTPPRIFHTIHNQCQAPSKKGQCTEWTDGRFYQLTGQHIEFSGPAHTWPAQASRNAKKWRVSSEPIVPSIAIFHPGTHGSSHTGHAAIIENKFTSGALCTSNWNAPTPGRLTLRKVQHIPGMVYITLR